MKGHEDGGSPTEEQGESIIRLRRVSKSFGGFEALRSVSADVSLGERVVVCGPSGSGKSTLVRCIGGLERHDVGTIVVDGVALDDRRESIASIRSRIGMVFQQFNLFPHLTVLRNLTLGPMRARGMTKAEAEGLATRYLERVHIPEQAHKFPRELSGGPQQQRGRHRPGPVHGAPHHALRRADFRPRPGDDQRGARGDGRARGERNDDDSA